MLTLVYQTVQLHCQVFIAKPLPCDGTVCTQFWSMENTCTCFVPVVWIYN